MLRELKILIAVVRHGTFAGAGKRIGLTQSAVNAQIQWLEGSLDFRLFDRMGRSAMLNAVGRDTLALVEHIVTLYARLSDQAGGNEQRDPVRTGATASVQTSFLVDMLVQLRREFPHCRVRIMPGVLLDLPGLVDAGEIDLVMSVRPSFTIPADLEWCAPMTGLFMLLVPANMSGGDWRALLAHQPSIHYDRRSFGGRRTDQLLRDQRITPYDVIELDKLQGMTQLVTRGQDVALVPQTAARDTWPPGTCVISLGDDTFYRKIGLIERPRRSRQPIVGWLAGYVDEAACAKRT